MNKNETPLQRMRIAIDAQGHFGSDGDETLNRQDIQLYALASIAESLARIASTVGNVSFDPQQPINAVRTSPWQ